MSHALGAVATKARRTTNSRVLTSLLKAAGQRLHFLVSFLLAAAIVPALRLSGLPLKFNWVAMLQTYWVAFSFQAIFAAVLLYLIGFPIESTFRPLWLRYTQDKRRLLLLAPFLLFLVLLYTRLAFLVLLPFMLVVALAVLEFFDRAQARTGFLSDTLSSVLLPAVYLFFGLVLVSGYNDIAVSSRPYVSYDTSFDRVDTWILFGATVPEIVHYALRAVPLRVFKILEFIYYYCMFPQIGAALILIAFNCGRKQTFRLTGTILTAYYLGLALFWLWPSQGPFFICARHFAEFPTGLATYSIQQRLLAQANSLWTGKGLAAIGLDYYIAFPSMHCAMPLIVAWYLRGWRKIVFFLLAIDLLLLVSIFLLEWHYVVDLLGGVAVAALSILTVEGNSLWTAFPTVPSGQVVASPNRQAGLADRPQRGTLFPSPLGPSAGPDCEPDNPNVSNVLAG